MLKTLVRLSIMFLLFYKTFVDVHMTSPKASPESELFGSFHTMGGTLCGHAVGNVFNFADAGDDNTEMVVLRTGKVHPHNSLADPTKVKAPHMLGVDIQTSMASVLKSTAEKWSPIECMSFLICLLTMINSILQWQSLILVFLFLNKVSRMSKNDLALQSNLMKMWNRLNRTGIITASHPLFC
jgi:hypothetical protein